MSVPCPCSVPVEERFGRVYTSFRLFLDSLCRTVLLVNCKVGAAECRQGGHMGTRMMSLTGVKEEVLVMQRLRGAGFKQNERGAGRFGRLLHYHPPAPIMT